VNYTFLQLNLVGIGFILCLGSALEVRSVLRSCFVSSLRLGCESSNRKGRGIARVIFALRVKLWSRHFEANVLRRIA
jgi:hypothetical protein